MPKRDEPPMQLPPNIREPEVKAAAEEYRKLVAELREEWGRYKVAEEGRRRAEDADRADFAAALRAGKADPGQKKLQEADVAILASSRRIDALQVAVAASRSELVDCVERHRTEWESSLEVETTEAAETFATAVDAMAAAHDALAEVLALRGWLSRMPGRAVWSQAGFTSAVPALARPGYDPPTWAVVLAAVREQAVLPARATVAAGV